MNTETTPQTALLRYANTPPTKEQLSQITDILRRRFQLPDMQVEVKQDEQIQSGFIISYKNFEYDWTERGRSEQLEGGLIISHDNFLRRRNSPRRRNRSVRKAVS